jgi:hypothetical protein
MSRRTASASPVYVVDIENDEWRMVIPIYRKLSPVPHKARFETPGEAEKRLSGADRQSTVAHLQTRSSTAR